MTTTLPPDTVALGRRSLHHLRAALERSLGVQAASLLQEAGFASGEAMFAAFEAWVGERYGVERAEALDGAYLGEALSSFFARQGWGSLTLERPTESVVVLEAREWAESAPGAGPYPSCHLSAGLMADLFSRMAGSQFAAMEVACRSRADEQCRFLLASPETLTLVYERMSHGMTYQQSLGLA